MREILEFLIGVIVVLFLLWLAIGIPLFFWTERQCLKHGWKGYEMSFLYERYCVREENEYEITKPLREIVK